MPSPTLGCYSLPCRKIASFFADFTLYKDIVKAVQSFVLRHRFVICFSLCFLFFFSAPLSRLAPIEALPQALQWALPLDPTSPLASGLTVRFIARFARWVLLLCLGVLLGLALPFLTPHSSLSLHLYSPILSRSHIFIPFEYHGEIRSVLKARFI